MSDKSREQFEAWWCSFSDKCRHPVDDVEYYAAKEAWQASRDAIEIELPGSFRESYQSSNMVIDEQDTIERLESYGLKVNT